MCKELPAGIPLLCSSSVFPSRAKVVGKYHPKHDIHLLATVVAILDQKLNGHCLCPTWFFPSYTCNLTNHWPRHHHFVTTAMRVTWFIRVQLLDMKAEAIRCF